MLQKSAEARTVSTVTIAFLAFIGLGLTSGLLGLAWPSMQKEFALPLDGVNTLYVVQTVAYTLASFYIGRLMSRFSSGTTLLAGVLMMGVAMFGIVASATWLVVIALSLVFGLGNGLLDAGLNMYMATYHTARQMNWLHACFGIGITVGPLIMTFVLQQQWGWRSGYAIVATILIGVILLFAFTRRSWRSEGLQTAENKPVRRASFAESLRVPVLWYSMATFTAYVGLEISVGQWAYTLLTASRAMPTGYAGLWVSVYWGVFTGGRILFGVVANRFEVDRVLRVCIGGAIVGAALFWWNPVPAVGLLGLVILGVAQAPVFPLLMMGTAKRIGAEHAENGISIQMGAVGIGAAILPGLIGTVGKNFGLEAMSLVFVIMALLAFVFHELARLGHAERPVLTSTGD
ncbi:MAG: MFS transporter [Chloroflexota bacterium]